MHSDLFCVAEVINILKDTACTAESTLHAQQLFGVTGANKMRAAGGCPYDVPERIVGASTDRPKVFVY